MMYFKKLNKENNVDCIVKIEEDKKMFIPLESGNRHYAEYLEWESQGNEAKEYKPEPSDA